VKVNEEVGQEVLMELRERAQQPEADKVSIAVLYCGTGGTRCHSSLRLIRLV
jgi:hypothetical protein